MPPIKLQSTNCRFSSFVWKQMWDTADFIETASHIEEALMILRKWNPLWLPSCVITLIPKFLHYQLHFQFICVTSTEVHEGPQTWSIYWRGWLSTSSSSMCMGTSSWPFDHHYKTAVSKLKESNPWEDNPQVKAWLQSKWLSNPKVMCIPVHIYSCTMHTHTVLIAYCTVHSRQ